jgi:hypothetical protein
MDNAFISQQRLINQKICNPDLKTAREIASRLGALQAQDYIMSKWALGLRTYNSTEESITQEINSGGIIRTHVLRPTWHIVSSEDVYWLIELSAPQIMVAMSYRDRKLELTKDLLNKAYKILINAMEGNKHRTREELMDELKRAGFRLDENRASHIFMRAEIEGLICSGRQIKNKPSFSLLEEWVPVKNKMADREAALHELGKRYFGTRGPATVRDFSWWSGLSLNDSRLALELNKPNLVSRSLEGQTYWFPESASTRQEKLNNFLLPSYDEFLISYRDRSAILQVYENGRVVSKNGIFYPTIVLNGKVAGIWKRSIKKDLAVLELDPFEYETGLIKIIGESIAKYSGFIKKEVRIEE